jgi:hypothetical protein
MMSEISIILYSVSMIIFAIAALIIFEKYDDDK